MEITDQREQTVTIHLSSENSTSIISSIKRSREFEPFGALDRINGRAGMKIHLELSEQVSDGLLIQLIAQDPTIPIRQDFRVFKPLQLISEDVAIQGISGLDDQGEISQTFSRTSQATLCPSHRKEVFGYKGQVIEQSSDPSLFSRFSSSRSNRFLEPRGRRATHQCVGDGRKNILLGISQDSTDNFYSSRLLASWEP